MKTNILQTSTFPPPPSITHFFFNFPPQNHSHRPTSKLTFPTISLTPISLKKKIRTSSPYKTYPTKRRLRLDSGLFYSSDSPICQTRARSSLLAASCELIPRARRRKIRNYACESMRESIDAASDEISRGGAFVREVARNAGLTQPFSRELIRRVISPSYWNTAMAWLLFDESRGCF